MATALARHGLAAGKLSLVSNICRQFATKAEKRKGIDKKVGPKIDPSAQSLAAKGFLRPQKEYTPPSDLSSKLQNILTNVLGPYEASTPLNEPGKRFAVFNACFQEFRHGIPNSLLYAMETVEDIIRFYETPVSTITPYDNLKNVDLPRNLHVQYEYHRFHPETDPKFGGVTAFPRSSTIVSGLKYKGKYKGHQQRETWPYTC